MKYKKKNKESEITPLQVKVENDNFDEALKKFKSMFQKEKILSELKERMAYEKPSEKRRRKRREAAEKLFVARLRERQIANGEWEKRQKKREKKRKENEEKTDGQA